MKRIYIPTTALFIKNQVVFCVGNFQEENGKIKYAKAFHLYYEGENLGWFNTNAESEQLLPRGIIDNPQNAGAHSILADLEDLTDKRELDKSADLQWRKINIPLDMLVTPYEKIAGPVGWREKFPEKKCGFPKLEIMFGGIIMGYFHPANGSLPTERYEIPHLPEQQPPEIIAEFL